MQWAAVRLTTDPVRFDLGRVLFLCRFRTRELVVSGSKKLLGLLSNLEKQLSW